MHATTMRIRPFDEADGPAVVALWQACGLTRPWNDPARDIARKLAVQRDLFLVGIHDGVLMASAMAGYDGHRGWVYYLAVDPAAQRKGCGTAMMQAAADWLRANNVPKLHVMIRSENLAVAAFYAKLGYEKSDTITMAKRL